MAVDILDFQYALATMSVPMTETLFRDDAYRQGCESIVTATGDDYIALDRTVFYPAGGGQPGDTGSLSCDGRSYRVIDTRYGTSGEIQHQLAGDSPTLAVGDKVSATIDWDRRYRHMRMHTALHLLGAVLKYGVTGGNISAEKSRLDFDMQDAVDKDAVNAAMHLLIAENHPVRCRWISDEELEAQPELVRTMSVQPPRGAGQVRLLDIVGVDLQPCGGTHLRSTGEVGGVHISKVEKKGKHNRRVYIKLDD